MTPYLDTLPRGLSATRAPSRPNRIGLSSVRLVSVEGSRWNVRGIHVLDRTPLLDIKPHVARFDCFVSARAGWLDSAKSDRIVADRRFEHSPPKS